MREIKFRQFINGKFHYWGNKNNDCFIGPVTPVIESQQFTGLKDKNGKEIYEGDLVRTIITIKKDEPGSRSRKDISVGTVIFKEGEYLPRNILNENWYSTIQTIDCWEGDYEPAIHRTSSVEVIGNIYENPELVGGTQKGLDLEG